MRWRGVAGVLAAASVVVGAGLLAYGLGVVELPGEDVHERAEVVVRDENGTVLAVVDARVADTRKERIRGLGGVERLPNGTGMLFVHAEEGLRTYVMRDMEVPLDIIFVGADRRVTSVRSAPVPPPGTDEADLRRYRGRAKWVLEVPRGFAERHGIEPGDRVAIRYGNRS